MPRNLNPACVALHSQYLPALAENTVSCIGICLDDDVEASYQAARQYVHAAEYLRAKKFFHPVDAARHMVGRALVRRIMAQELGSVAAAAEFVLNPWGKPGLKGREIEFSIAHSGHWVWAAFCRTAAVGIDVEEAQSLHDLAELVDALHPGESNVIRQLTAPEASAAFYRCWIRKEAVLKASGEGLSRPLNSFRVKTNTVSRDWLVEISGDRADNWTTADVAISGEDHCSLAVAAHTPKLAVIAHVLAG